MKVELVKIKDEYYVYNKCNLVNDKYEYFVKGKGWKKTKKFEIVKVEMPESKDNLYDIRKIGMKYGKDICMKYLITNNMDSWKEHIYHIAVKSDMNKKEAAAFLKFWKILNVEILHCFGFFNIFDIRALDNLLANKDKEYDNVNCTYKGKENVSMNEYVAEKFGKVYSDMLRKLI